jgi:hypothetical protein
MTRAHADVEIVGELYGHRLEEEAGRVRADVVHVTGEGRPDGPAENAFVLVEHLGTELRARYISWINYFDLDYVIEREHGRWWRSVEPPNAYRELVMWTPFGWPGTLKVPTVGDLAHHAPPAAPGRHAITSSRGA